MIYDVCIVGGGPAGLTLADRLTEGSAAKVALVEAGGDTVANVEAARFVSKGKTRYEPIRQFMLGGHGHLWGGACPRLDPADFKMQSLYGIFADWPIDYSEFSSYYEQAERILGVQSRHIVAQEQLDGEPFFQEFERRGIAGDIHYGNQRYFVDNLIPALRKRGVEIRLHSVVQSVQEQENGIGVVTYCDDATLLRKEIKARFVIIACGGLSNARILQLSRDNRWPNGLGNHAGHLGCYLMDHPRNVLRLSRSRNGPPKEVFEGRYPYDLVKPVSVGEPSVAYGSIRISGKIDVSLSLEKLGRVFDEESERRATKDCILRSIGTTHSIEFDFECMDPPVEESRIGLAEEVDKFGAPRMATYMSLNAERVKSNNSLYSLLKETFGLHGYEIDLVESTGMVGQHPSGTTRMAAKREDGVVDADLKVFDTRSVYVLGSSVFPTVGYANPTLTIVSLALRLADHLAKRLAESDA